MYTHDPYDGSQVPALEEKIRRLKADVARRHNESEARLQRVHELAAEVLRLQSMSDSVTADFATEADLGEDDPVRAIVERQAATIRDLVLTRAGLRKPELILAEAESLIRKACVPAIDIDVYFGEEYASISPFSTIPGVDGDSLPLAFAKLTGGPDAG